MLRHLFRIALGDETRFHEREHNARDEYELDDRAGPALDDAARDPRRRWQCSG